MKTSNVVLTRQQRFKAVVNKFNDHATDIGGLLDEPNLVHEIWKLFRGETLVTFPYKGWEWRMFATRPDNTWVDKTYKTIHEDTIKFEKDEINYGGVDELPDDWETIWLTYEANGVSARHRIAYRNVADGRVYGRAIPANILKLISDNNWC